MPHKLSLNLSLARFFTPTSLGAEDSYSYQHLDANQDLLADRTHFEREEVSICEDFGADEYELDSDLEIPQRVARSLKVAPPRHPRNSRSNSSASQATCLYLVRPLAIRLRQFLLPPGIAFWLRLQHRHSSSPPKAPFILPHHHLLRSRRLLAFLAFIFSAPLFLVALVLLYGGTPPSYTDVREQERALPQHKWRRGAEYARSWSVASMPPESHELYLRFPDHIWGHGLNNVLQEALLTSLIASASNRTFVFEDYVWSHLPLPYTLYDFALRPTRVPLGAFLGGWLVGEGSEHDVRDPINHFNNTLFPQDSFFSSTNHRQLRISAEYFEHVCPPSARVEIVYSWPTSTYEESSSTPDKYADGEELLQWWRNRLAQDDVKNARCVVGREYERRVFDFDFFGSSRPLALFPHLLSSPVLNSFQWSPLVRGAINRTLDHFFPQHHPHIHSPSSPPLPTNIPPATELQATPQPQIVQGMLAIHLRRGDYKRHCVRLAEADVGYMSWNRMVGSRTFEEELESHLGDQVDPDFVDDDESPAMNEAASNSNSGIDEDQEKKRRKALKEDFYLQHCLPSIPQIVDRIRRVREDYESNPHAKPSALPRKLTQIYILTNGWPSFLDQLRVELLKDGWDRVVGSMDLFDEGSPLSSPFFFGSPSSDVQIELETKDRDGNPVPSRPSSTSSFFRLSKEEKGVSAAIDMGLGERAEVFIGNGFSSLSANIVMLRLAKGLNGPSNWLL